MKFTTSEWLYTNRALLKKHQGEWIAYNEQGIIANAKKLADLYTSLEGVKEPYRIYLVPKILGGIRVLPIKFKTVHFGEWTPNYPVTLHNGSRSISTDMLIDSGADTSLISYEIGLSLGLKHDSTDIIDEAHGIGGGAVRLTFKRIELEINGIRFFAPIAWILDENYPEMIIGREVVFDLFDIEFKQADKQIEFRYRNNHLS